MYAYISQVLILIGHLVHVLFNVSLSCQLHMNQYIVYLRVGQLICPDSSDMHATKRLAAFPVIIPPSPSPWLVPDARRSCVQGAWPNFLPRLEFLLALAIQDPLHQLFRVVVDADGILGKQGAG